MNSLLTKLMPATAALHDAAESALRAPQALECGSPMPLSHSPVRAGHSRIAPSVPVLKFKYVIFRAGDYTTAAIVPPFAKHSDIINLARKTPLSAGFAWRNEDGSITVEGESDSLHLTSRPEDAEILRETLIMSGL